MTIQLGFKRCHRCGITKARSDFAKDGSTVQSACRECKAKRNREWYANHREHSATKQETYRTQFPEKRAAHLAVQRAVASGQMLVPAACVECAKVGKVEAHHPDYSQPLHVLWLCRSCHRAAHAQESA